MIEVVSIVSIVVAQVESEHTKKKIVHCVIVEACL